jgi:uncharacterized membrane protein
MDTHARTLLKSIIYRVVSILITALWIGLTASIEIHLVLLIWYYIHERAWLKIKWGLNGSKE